MSVWQGRAHVVEALSIGPGEVLPLGIRVLHTGEQGCRVEEVTLRSRETVVYEAAFKITAPNGRSTETMAKVPESISRRATIVRRRA